MSNPNHAIELISKQRDKSLEAARENAKWAAQTEEKARDYRAKEAAFNEQSASCEQAIADIKAAYQRRVIYGREVLQ